MTAVRFWTKHFFAAIVHTAAFGFLIGYAINKQPLSKYGDGNYWIDTGRVSWEPIAWKYKCKLPCKETKSETTSVCNCQFFDNATFYKSIFDSSCDCYNYFVKDKDGNCPTFQHCNKTYPGTPYTYVNRCECETNYNISVDEGETLHDCRPQSCPDSQKQFYVTKPDGAIAINIIALASFYVAWSAVGHYVVWGLQRWHREIRYIDYMVTAPTMLVVLAATYGMTSLWTLVNSALLGFLLLFSYFVERPDGSPSSGLLETRAILFYLLVLAYLFVISPILYSAIQITNESRHPAVDPNDHLIGYGTAPDFVLAFAVLTLLIFSCFVVPFAVDLLNKPLDNRESIYITLSMIA